MKYIFLLTLFCAGCIQAEEKSVSEHGLSLYRTRLYLAIALLEQPIQNPQTNKKLGAKASLFNPKKQQRHVLFFTADWCSPCRRWKATELPRLQASGWNEEWISVVDIDRQRELQTRYQIKTVPTFVVIKNDRVIGHRVGFVDYLTFANWVNGLK